MTPSSLDLASKPALCELSAPSSAGICSGSDSPSSETVPVFFLSVSRASSSSWTTRSTSTGTFATFGSFIITLHPNHAAANLDPSSWRRRLLRASLETLRQRRELLAQSLGRLKRVSQMREPILERDSRFEGRGKLAQTVTKRFRKLIEFL